MKRILTLLLTVLMVLSMGVCSVSADGELVHGGIAESKADTTVTYTSKLYNGTATEASAVMLVAVYDEVSGAKKLSDVDIFPLAEAVGVGETGELEGSVTVSDSQISSAFIWDSTESLKPIKAAADMTAPVVTVDAVTNSTVELSWTNAASGSGVPILRHALAKTYEGANPVYEQMTGNSYKEVGIKHDTPISYQVIATDALGRQIRSEAADVRTDDIGRITFADYPTSTTFAADTALQGHNLSVINTSIGEKQASDSDTLVAESQFAIADDTVIVNNASGANAKLGFTSLALNGRHAALRFSIDPTYADTLAANSDSDDVKFIVNYYNNTWTDSTGGWLRWRMSATDTSTTGYLQMPVTNTQEWQTGVYTIKNNSAAADRKTWDFAPSNASVPSLSFESRNTNTSNILYVSKIEVVDEDYVPYGAVIDFNDQGETQFVKFIRRHGYNGQTIANYEGMRAIELPYAASSGNGNSLLFGIDDNYLSADAQDYILRVTYYNDGKLSANDLRVWYGASTGNGVNSIVPKAGEGIGWQTAEFKLNGVKLNTGKESIRIYNTDDDQAPKYISRVELIKK